MLNVNKPKNDLSKIIAGCNHADGNWRFSWQWIAPVLVRSYEPSCHSLTTHRPRLLVLLAVFETNLEIPICKTPADMIIIEALQVDTTALRAYR